MITKLKEYLVNHKVNIVLISIIFIILITLSIMRYLSISRPFTQVHKEDPQAIIQTYSVDSSVSAQSKDSVEDPDVILKQTYVAEVNGQRVEVPVVNAQAGKDTQGTITQEVNIQPVVDLAIKDAKESVKKNWEAGAGVYVHASEVLPMVSIQRNYSTTHAVEVQLAGDREGLKGGSLAWKVKF